MKTYYLIASALAVQLLIKKIRSVLSSALPSTVSWQFSEIRDSEEKDD